MEFNRIVVFPDIDPVIKKCIDELDEKTKPKTESSPAIIQKKKNDYIVQCNRCHLLFNKSLTYQIILDDSHQPNRYCKICTGVIAIDGTGIIIREDD